MLTRTRVQGGTHSFKADGVVYYNGGLLPGYAALFRHPNDELNYCCYLIPGNPQVTNDKMAFWHEELLRNDPYVRNSLGNKYKIEPMKAAPLRLGGIDNSYDEHLLIVGDAAGMIDPMTGGARAPPHRAPRSVAVRLFDSTHRRQRAFTTRLRAARLLPSTCCVPSPPATTARQ